MSQGSFCENLIPFESLRKLPGTMLAETTCGGSHESQPKPFLVRRHPARLGVRFPFLEEARGHQFFHLCGALSRHGHLPDQGGWASPRAALEPAPAPHYLSLRHDLYPPGADDDVPFHIHDAFPHGSFCPDLPQRTMDPLWIDRLFPWLLASVRQHDRPPAWIQRGGPARTAVPG